MPLGDNMRLQSRFVAFCVFVAGFVVILLAVPLTTAVTSIPNDVVIPQPIINFVGSCPTYFTSVDQWGTTGSGAGEFDSPVAVAVDREEPAAIHVLDRGNARVQKFSAEGVYQLEYGNESGRTMIDPNGLDTGARDYIYIADTGQRRLLVYEPSGLFIDQSRDTDFDPPLNLPTVWGTGGIDDSGIELLYFVDRDQCRLYATDIFGRRVIHQHGRCGNTIDQFSAPQDVAVFDSVQADEIAVYVADTGNHRFVKLNYRLEVNSLRLGGGGSLPGLLNAPGAIAVDYDQCVYVADTGNNRVQVFADTVDHMWLSALFGSGTLASPSGIAVDPAQCVYVADTGNDRIVKYCPSSIQPPAGTFLASTSTAGDQGDNVSSSPVMSHDGRFIAFTSDASNLVEEDQNRASDVFVRDLQTGETTRVSVSSAGEEGNNASVGPDISDDGRYVAFESYADNLVQDDDNATSDIFVHDRLTGQTELISQTDDGEQPDQPAYAANISGNGRYVVFTTPANNLAPVATNSRTNVYLHDRVTGEFEWISRGLGGTAPNAHTGAWDNAISADGRYIVFETMASNIVVDDTNGQQDIFVYDRISQQIRRVTGRTIFGEPNAWSGFSAISDDGSRIVFSTYANTFNAYDNDGLLDPYVYDLLTGHISWLGVGFGSAAHFPVLSDDGRYLVFISDKDYPILNDTNGMYDVFLYDFQTSQMELVSVGRDNVSGDGAVGYTVPAISTDGRLVIFSSQASNLTEHEDRACPQLDPPNCNDIFVSDRGAALTQNYREGAPGSHLAVTGRFYSPDSQVTATVNGRVLGTAAAGSDGTVTIDFDTALADPGWYSFMLSDGLVTTTGHFVLRSDAPLRERIDAGVLVTVPEGIAFTNRTFLPALQR